MKTVVRAMHLPLNELVVAALGTLAAFIIGHAFASGNLSLGLLIPAVTIAVALLSVLQKEHGTVVLLLILATPGVGSIGSGALYGVNLKTLLVILMSLHVAYQRIASRQRPTPTEIAVPFGLFILLQLLSYVRGVTITDWQPYGGTGQSFGLLMDMIPGFMQQARDLFTPWLLYMVVVHADLNELWIRRLWIAFLSITLVSALLLTINWFTTSPLFSIEAPWYRARTLNIEFFALYPFEYLLPLNLIMARLTSSRVTPGWQLLGLGGIVLLSLAVISPFKRTELLAIPLTLGAWLVLKPTARRLRLTLLLACLLAAIVAFSALNTHLTQLYQYTTSPEQTSIRVLGVYIQSSGRFDKIYPYMLWLWRQNRVLGIGFGQAVQRYRAPHNVYLGWLVETGLVGLIAGLAFFYVITRTLWRLQRSPYSSPFIREIALGLSVFWIGFLWIALWEDNLWTNWPNSFMMLLAACLALVSRRRLAQALTE